MADTSKIEAMMDDARLMMMAQDVSFDTLKPEVVVVATNEPRDIKRAVEESWQQYLDTQYSFGKDVSIEEKANASYAHDQSSDIENTIFELAKPARRRTRIGGVVAGVALSAFALIGIGATKYELAAKDPAVTKTVLKGDPILENNSLVYDPSILSGDTGKDIPVVGPVLEHVPGVPDFGGFEAKVPQIEVTETTNEEVTLEGGYATGNAQNPVAPDLQLTGVEYQQGRAAAADVLSKIDPAHFAFKAITIEGLASDELNGKLGEADPQLEKLAWDRAQVAKQAFIDEAASRDILIPNEMTVVSGHEVVDHVKASTILQIANENRMPIATLIDAYNTGKPLPEGAQAAMDDYLGKNRGAQFKILGNKEVTRQVKKPALTDKGPVDKEYEDTVPGEAIVALPLLVGVMYGNIVAFASRHRRSARREARKQVSKAGLEL